MQIFKVVSKESTCKERAYFLLLLDSLLLSAQDRKQKLNQSPSPECQTISWCAGEKHTLWKLQDSNTGCQWNIVSSPLFFGFWSSPEASAPEHATQEKPVFFCLLNAMPISLVHAHGERPCKWEGELCTGSWTCELHSTYWALLGPKTVQVLGTWQRNKIPTL